MSIAPNPADAPIVVRITAGVDRATDDHAVCVVGEQGEVLDRFTVTHDAAGLKRMAALLLRAGPTTRSASNAVTARSWTPCWRPR